MGAVLDLVLDIVIESLKIILETVLKGFLGELALIPDGRIVAKKIIYMAYDQAERAYNYVVSYRKCSIRI